MNVSLTPELEKFVDDKVATGMYQTASEVVREALRLLGEEDARRRAEIERIREKLAKSVAELDAGLGVSAEEAWDMVRRRNKDRKSA
jgi:antitoxin ParD1/3/4